MILLTLALSAAAPVPQPMPSEAACRLASAGRIRPNKTFTLNGTYFRGTHAADVELPKCDASIVAILVGDAEVAVSTWHAAYREKCGNWLYDDMIRGTFTGTFVRKRLRVSFTGTLMMTEIFMIRAIESPDLDIASIKCAGSSAEGKR